MAALDFTDLAAMLAFVTSKLVNPNATELETLLESSAATSTLDCLGYVDGKVEETQAGYVKSYRPYWVIASYPLMFPSAEGYNPALYESMRGAAGSSVKFRDPLSVHDQQMKVQRAFDLQFCNIPKGFEAIELKNSLQSAKMVRG